MSIKNNTTSKHFTHFLTVPQLLEEALIEFNMCSENWSYPTGIRLGDPQDPYYAEIWTNGMDWNKIYWIVETINFSSPKAYPLVFFENHESHEKFNDYDFKKMMRFFMYFRRNKCWIEEEDVHDEEISPYLKFYSHKIKENLPDGMLLTTFSHGSQQEIRFYTNFNIIY
jgi:hypothetical protein